MKYFFGETVKGFPAGEHDIRMTETQMLQFMQPFERSGDLRKRNIEKIDDLVLGGFSIDGEAPRTGDAVLGECKQRQNRRDVIGPFPVDGPTDPAVNFPQTLNEYQCDFPEPLGDRHQYILEFRCRNDERLALLKSDSRCGTGTAVAFWAMGLFLTLRRRFR